MDKDKFTNYAELRWSNLRTRHEYLMLAKRISSMWEGDNFTQATLNRFQAELLSGARDGRLNSLYLAFLHNYVECYSDDVIDAGQRAIKVVTPASRQIVRVEKYKFLSRGELNSLMNCLKDEPYLKITAQLMAQSGLRISELLAIKWSDIDLTNRIIKGIGKGNKEFRILISPKMADEIQKWYRNPLCTYKERPFAVIKRFQEPHPIKESAQRNYYWRLLSKCLESKNFPRHVHPHMLRHSFARWCRDKAGMRIEDLRVAMRHSNIQSTAIYSVSTEAEVAKTIDEKLFGVKNQNLINK